MRGQPLSRSSEPLETPRVLIVEDDPDQRELIRETLRIHSGKVENPRVIAVGTGAQCMAQDLWNVDIVLLDHNLPDTTGLELLGRILQKRDLPVLFVTGENDSATAVEAIRHGAQDYIVKLGDYLMALPLIIEKNVRLHKIKRENARLQAELTASIDEIRVKNIQLEESLEKLEAMAAMDPLTGLANRRAFADRLARSYDEATRYDFDLACAMCDLDSYKSLNDSLGHQAGDRILVTTAEVIRRNLRSSDAAARYGGDEFVILLPHTSIEVALNVSDRIREQLRDATSQCTNASEGITLSAGVASLKSDHPASADALVAMADRALYAAKDRGKNRIATFSQIRSAPPTNTPSAAR